MASPEEPRRGRRATLRFGARERTRMQAAVIILILVLLAVGLRPFLLNLIAIRDYQACQTNARKIAQALTMYAQGWDDSFPAASSWLDSVRGNLAPTTGSGFSADHYLKCPTDRSDSGCSYVYNALMEGLSMTVRQAEPEKAARRAQLRRLDRAPVVIEKHGSKPNSALALGDWNAVRAAMDRPHNVPEPTGSLILGNGQAWHRNNEQLDGLADRRF